MESKWMTCPNCGHKLFKLIDGKFTIEIKCPSCKRIETITQDTKGRLGRRVALVRMPS